MNDLGISLVGASARVTVLAMVGLALAFLMRRRGSSAVVLATLWTLSGLVVVSALSLSPWPRFWGVDFEAAAISSALNAPITADRTDPPTVASTTDARQRGLRDTRLADFAKEFLRELQYAGTPSTVADSGPFSSWKWPAWVSLGLLVGVGFGLARLAIALRTVARLRRQCEPVRDPEVLDEIDCLRAAIACTRPVELRESAHLTTAATVGWRCPVLLLPADWRTWTVEERQAALAHELAHVRAGDYLSGLWAHVCLSMHIYHPLAHWLVAQLRLEQELAADALAARVSGGTRAYLESLARLALRRPGPMESRPLAGLWPARPFLPTRGTLLRRIEMLRDPKSHTTRTEPLSWPGRVFTIAALAVTGLVLVGLRGPDSPARAQAPSRALLARVDAQDAQGSSSDAFDLSHAPADTILAVAGKPAAILSRPEFEPLVKMLKPEANSLLKALGLGVDEIETVKILALRSMLSGPGPGGAEGFPATFMIRTIRQLDGKAVETALVAEPARNTFEGIEIVRSQALHSAFVKLDDRTLVIGPERDLRQVIVAQKGGPIRHPWDEAWSKVKKGQAGVAVDATAFAALLLKNSPPGGRPEMLTAVGAMAAPLLEKGLAYGLGIDIEKGLVVDLVAVASSNEAAQDVADTLKALAVLGKNSLETLHRQIPPNQVEGQAALVICDVLEPLFKNVKTEVHGSVVELRSATDQNIAGLVAPLIPAVGAARRRHGTRRA